MRRLLTLIVLVAACGLTGPDDTTIRVEGAVTSAADGSPTAQATVTAGLRGFTERETLAESSTDDLGRYALSFVKTGHCVEGRFFMKASKSGFLPSYVIKSPDSVDHIRCTEDVQTINFQLEPEP